MAGLGWGPDSDVLFGAVPFHTCTSLENRFFCPPRRRPGQVTECLCPLKFVYLASRGGGDFTMLSSTVSQKINYHENIIGIGSSF